VCMSEYVYVCVCMRVYVCVCTSVYGVNAAYEQGILVGG
jgi:hypothetical protein